MFNLTKNCSKQFKCF